MPGLGQIHGLGDSNAYGAYGYQSGVGAAVVAVPQGAYLSTVAAFATATGATMTIGGGTATPIPFPGAASQDVDAGIQGPVNVTFAGAIGGYLVDWFTLV